MKKITKDAHAISIGRFYRVAWNYSEKFGNRRLQGIIGKDLFYKEGKEWWWNNPKIIKMTTLELKNIIKKIETI